MNAVARVSETRGRRVLIVEDEHVVATHVERSLQDVGYVVTGIAASASEAQSLALAVPPDVALVDIRLRGKGEGFEIAERLRIEHDVPVVYMTAHTDDDTLQRAARTGAYGYVVKPFTIGEVKSALEVALYKHGLDQHLAERERWFSTTLRAIADGVVACDLEQRVTFLNQAAERMLSRHEEQARGLRLGELLGQLRPDLPEVALALEQRRPAPLSFEIAGPGTSGAILIQGTAAPMIHLGRVLGAVLVLHDVTEQRRRDEQLALTDRLSSLGTLVASVAHEINNPLAYTLGNLGLAGQELERIKSALRDVELREALERVIDGLRDAENGASRVSNTVKELRAFGRMEERSQRAVDPRACVDWALRLTSNQLLHRARLLTSLRDVPHVMANELKLSQVVVNLLTNAVQALNGERENNEISVATWTDEHGYAVLEVEDNGRGMSEEVRLAVFEPFFTTKMPGHGTGLGLSICRNAVQSFGGEITVESQLGRGSRFQVRLPPCKEGSSGGEDPRPSTAGVRLSSRPPGTGPKVLFIDDEPMICALATRVLSSRFRVSSVESVRAALALLNEAHDFDAIVCDLMLPGESGIDFFAVVRRLYPDLVGRMAFITGGAVTPDTSKFLETASCPVLNKPFNPESLMGFVEAVAGGTATRGSYRPAARPSETR